MKKFKVWYVTYSGVFSGGGFTNHIYGYYKTIEEAEKAADKCLDKIKKKEADEKEKYMSSLAFDFNYYTLKLIEEVEVKSRKNKED